jgi:hypothetical protein
LDNRNSLNAIGSRLIFEGDGHIREESVPVSATQTGFAQLLENSPEIFWKSELLDQSFAGGDGKVVRYSNPNLQPIIFKNGDDNVGLRVAVVNSFGAIEENLVHEKGVQKYGVQKRDAQNQLLYYTEDGEETTSSASRIPVVVETSKDFVDTATGIKAQPVYLNLEGHEIFFDNSGSGLLGEYYDNVDFAGTPERRVDPTVNFSFGNGQPHEAISPDTFSIRWSGLLQPITTGAYTLSTISDDGVRLWVNGELLFSNWTDHGDTKNSGNIHLDKNKFYQIEMEMYENEGGGDRQAIVGRTDILRTDHP